MKFQTDGGYCGNIVLPERFFRENLKQLSATETKLYLTVVFLAHKKEKAEWQDLKTFTGIPLRECVEALQSLEQKGLLRLTPASVIVSAPQPEADTFAPVAFKTYTPEEIEQMDDSEITDLTQCAEKAFGKLLNYGEISVLVSLYRWVGINTAVLMVMIEYLAALGKKSIGYLKSTALDWHEKGIDTAEKAHAHITYLEQQKEYYAQMRTVLGIFGRDFTKKEKEFLDTWQPNFSPEQIHAAYETTIDKTGKISFAYMNKILCSDSEKPLVPKSTKGATKTRITPSKFNNFEPREKDYDAMKEKTRQRAKRLAKNL